MRPESGKLVSINITGIIHEEPWAGDKGRSGIDKRPVDRSVNLANNSVEGDFVGDSKSHGGYDKAVYSYAREDADWWEGELGMPIASGRFGENLTTQGIDVSCAVIGELWHVGGAILEVAQPRTPCRVFAGFWDRPNLIKEFTDAGRPGAYLRIIEEGQVSAGDIIEIAFRPSHGISVAKMFTARGEDRFAMFGFLAKSDSSESVKQWASRMLIRK
jgi:MOSC domain-containing protein YiiM